MTASSAPIVAGEARHVPIKSTAAKPVPHGSEGNGGSGSDGGVTTGGVETGGVETEVGSVFVPDPQAVSNRQISSLCK